MEINIYTDGSCLTKNNSGKGPGGFAAIILDTDNEWTICGGEKDTTNNRMEMMAIIEALDFCDNKNKYVIHSDSQLCINCCTGKWKRNKNLDLWKMYDERAKGKKITFKWVKGHNGDKYNEIVDKIARDEAIKFKHINC